MMSKKVYEVFASAVKQSFDKVQLVESMIRIFKEDNPRFDETRFREAAQFKGRTEDQVKLLGWIEQFENIPMKELLIIDAALLARMHEITDREVR